MKIGKFITAIYYYVECYKRCNAKKKKNENNSFLEERITAQFLRIELKCEN